MRLTSSILLTKSWMRPTSYQCSDWVTWNDMFICLVLVHRECFKYGHCSYNEHIKKVKPLPKPFGEFFYSLIPFAYIDQSELDRWCENYWPPWLSKLYPGSQCRLDWPKPRAVFQMLFNEQMNPWHRVQLASVIDTVLPWFPCRWHSQISMECFLIHK